MLWIKRLKSICRLLLIWLQIQITCSRCVVRSIHLLYARWRKKNQASERTSILPFIVLVLRRSIFFSCCHCRCYGYTIAFDLLCIEEEEGPWRRWNIKKSGKNPIESLFLSDPFVCLNTEFNMNYFSSAKCMTIVIDCRSFSNKTIVWSISTVLWVE